MESKDFGDLAVNANQDLENNNDPNNNSSDNEGPAGFGDPIPGPSNPLPHFQNDYLDLRNEFWRRNEIEARSSRRDLDDSLNLVTDNRKRRSWDDEKNLIDDVFGDRRSDFYVSKRRKFPLPSSTITSADAEDILISQQNNSKDEAETKRDNINLPGPSGIKKSETNVNGDVFKNENLQDYIRLTSSVFRLARKSFKNKTFQSASQRNAKGPSNYYASNSLPSSEVITLTDSPPHVFENNDTEETVSSLSLMFPNTPIAYLRYGASKIVTETPEYFDWFVFDLGSRNGVPPVDWKLDSDVLFVSESGLLQNAKGDWRQKRPRRAQPTQTSESIADLLAPLVEDDTTIVVDDLSPQLFRDFPTPLDSLPAPPVVEIDSQKVPNGVAAVCDAPSQESTQEELIASKFETLCSLFPKADPDSLYIAAETYNTDEVSFSAWVTEHMETDGRNLPTREKYDKNLQKSKLLEKFQAQVSVTDLLATYEDPESYFLDRSRPKTDLYKRNTLNQLKKDFRLVHCNVIVKAFLFNNELYLPTSLYLKGRKNTLRKFPRALEEVPSDEDYDEAFLKERQYLSNRDEVQSYVLSKNRDRDNRLEEARTRGLLRVCDCCASDDCLEDEMLSCEGGHDYCVECIKRASNVAIGDGKIDLKCLMHCEKTFSLVTLQKVLSPNTFSKWLQRIQLEELQKADIDGLETCPFCTFATIIDVPAEDFRVFTCLNPDCGKESCRLCREMSHIPLRCDEVECDKEVQLRTYIENKMTEALVRKCYKCKRPYVKLDGCNKITCSHCGSKMCYICRKPVKDYSHFYGQGSLPSGNSLCPLWTDNHTVHTQDVARGAREAMAKVEKEQPGLELKYDPTKDLNLSKRSGRKARVQQPMFT